MKKIYLLIFILTTLIVSCSKEYDIVPIGKQSIIFYNLMLKNNSIEIINDQFSFFCYDTTSVYYSEINREGQYSELLNISSVINYESDSIANLNSIKLDDGSKLIFAILNNNTDYFLIKYDENLNLQWITSDTINLMINFFGSSIAQHSNGILSVNFLMRNPGQQQQVIKKKYYNSQNGYFVNENVALIDDMVIENLESKTGNGIYIIAAKFGGGLGDFIKDSITFVNIDNNISKIIKTNFKSTSSYYSNIVDNNLFFTYTDAESILNFAQISFDEGVVWNKLVLSQNDSLSFTCYGNTFYNNQFTIYGSANNYETYKNYLFYLIIDLQGNVLKNQILDINISEISNIIVNSDYSSTVLSNRYNIGIIKFDSNGKIRI